MTLLEIRIALHILATLILNGATIAFWVVEVGWTTISIPVMGVVTAIQLNEMMPRRDRSSPTVLSRLRRKLETGVGPEKGASPLGRGQPQTITATGEALSVVDKDAEIARLRREVGELRQDKETLRKAVNHFAREIRR